MFGGSWITTVLVICPFLVVAAVCLPCVLLFDLIDDLGFYIRLFPDICKIYVDPYL